MNKRFPIIMGLILLAVALWLLTTSFMPARYLLSRMENMGYDIQLRSRLLTSRHAIPKSPVVIVDIDDKSIKGEGRWPWPRRKLAKLIDQLQIQGAAVIAFDIFFSEKQKNVAQELINKLSEKKILTGKVREILEQSIPWFNDDAIFIKSITANQVILPYGFLPRRETQNALPSPLSELSEQREKDLRLITVLGYISNLPDLQKAAKGGGFINIFPDEDGIVRRAPLLLVYQGKVYPAIALQAAMTFLSEDAKIITAYYNKREQIEGVQIGSHMIPTDASGSVLIPFIGRSYTFPYYSAIDVLSNRLPPDTLVGKIVFVGTSATGLGDLQPTSIQNPFPGVEIQASLIEGILLGGFSHNPAWTLGANVVLTFLFGLLAAFGFPYLGPRILTVIVIFFPIGLLYFNNLIWIKTGLILSLIMPIFLVVLDAIFNIIYGYFFETRHREQLKEIFGQYVPETHINEMLKSKGKFNLHGEDKEMTVMFADIRNFTSISENMRAADITEMLNTYFTPMTQIIYKYKGTVDKYIGDLIMAFWGAPLTDKEHAYHALQSALEMQAELVKLKDILSVKGWPEITIGIGINTGKMSVGDMGSRFRRNYTVLGDAVNLASRVESLTKFYGVSILVTENIRRGQTKFIFRKVDRVRVKGKKDSVDIHEVIGWKARVTPAVIQELEAYHIALDLYYAQKWDAAYHAMNQLHQEHPSRKIYSLYMRRIKGFEEQPPSLDWDGTHVHLEK